MTAIVAASDKAESGFGFRKPGVKTPSVFRSFPQASWTPLQHAKKLQLNLAGWQAAVSSALTMNSMLEAGGYTWPRSLLCRSRIRCMSPSLMALFPLDLAFHHSSFLSLNLSRMDSSWVEFVMVMARMVRVKYRNKPAALTHQGKGKDVFMTDDWCYEGCLLSAKQFK